MSLLAAMDLSTVDPDKLGKLLDLQAAWEDRQAEKALNVALAAFQSECPTIKKARKNTHLNTAYAKIDDIMSAIQPTLSKHGLSVSFDTPSTPESLTAICYVMHSAGAKFSRQVTVPVDKGMRGANITQQLGSASSYAQRYALIAALNLNVTDREDDDGGASGSATITEAQATEIRNMIEDLPVERKAGFMEWIGSFGANSIDTIPSASFGKVIANLKKAGK